MKTIAKKKATPRVRNKTQRDPGTIGHNITLIRGMYKETMDDFAKRVGSNQKNVWTYENGVAKPKNEFLLALSGLTGLSTEVLTTVKLKANSEGRISNLPQLQKEVVKLYQEMNKIHNNFLKEVDRMQGQVNDVLKRANSIINMLEVKKRKVS